MPVQLRPNIFILEQVPELLTDSGGATFASLLAQLVDVGYGVAYRAVWLPSLGVPQNRARLLVLGVFGGEGAAAASALLVPTGPDPPPRARVLAFTSGEAKCVMQADLAPTLLTGGHRGYFIARGELYHINARGRAMLQGLSAARHDRLANALKPGELDVAVGNAAPPVLVEFALTELRAAAVAAVAGHLRVLPPFCYAPQPVTLPRTVAGPVSRAKPGKRRSRSGKQPRGTRVDGPRTHIHGTWGYMDADGAQRVGEADLSVGRALAPGLLTFFCDSGGCERPDVSHARRLWGWVERYGSAVGGGSPDPRRNPETIPLPRCLTHNVRNPRASVFTALPTVVAYLAACTGVQPPAPGQRWAVLRASGGGKPRHVAMRVVSDAHDESGYPLVVCFGAVRSCVRVMLLPPLPPVGFESDPVQDRGVGTADGGLGWRCYSRPRSRVVTTKFETAMLLKG